MANFLKVNNQNQIVFIRKSAITSLTLGPIVAGKNDGNFIIWINSHTFCVSENFDTEAEGKIRLNEIMNEINE